MAALARDCLRDDLQIRNLQASLSATLGHDSARLYTLIPRHMGPESAAGGDAEVKRDHGTHLNGQAWDLGGVRTAEGHGNLESIAPETDLRGILAELLEV